MNAIYKKLVNSLAGSVCAGIVLLMSSSATAQNLFVSDYSSDNIYEFSSSGTQSNTLASSLHGPYGLAFNKAGVLFEADQISGNVYEITNGTKVLFASGFSYPSGLAFDSAGNLFVANQNGNIVKVTPNGTESTNISGLFNPSGLAFDRAGNLYVTSFQDISGTIGNAYVYKYATNGTQSIYATNGAPVALAFDGVGNLFVANAYSNTVTKITPNGMQSTFASLYNPWGLAFDAKGNLFVADATGGNVIEITPAGIQSTNISELSAPVGLAFAPLPALAGGMTNGSYRLVVSMPSPYYSTVVQASTNFINWTAICTNTPPFVYTDSVPAACRFYRAFLGQ